MNTLSFFNPRFASDLFDVFDRNFTSFSDEKTPSKAVPKVDVIEKEKAYVLDMELPGFSEENVTIDLKDRVLSISSKFEKTVEKKEDGSTENSENKKTESKDKDGTFLIRERYNRQFSRHFTLPEDIDSENVTASFKNGLLTINIPKRASSEARRIAISA